MEDGSVDQSAAKDGGEKLVLWYALEIKSTRHTDKLDIKERENWA